MNGAWSIWSVSPQQVRTYCQNGDTIEWHTNGNRGGRRIDVNQDFEYPHHQELQRQMEITGERNVRIIRILDNFSKEESLQATLGSNSGTSIGFSNYPDTL